MKTKIVALGLITLLFFSICMVLSNVEMVGAVTVSRLPLKILLVSDPLGTPQNYYLPMQYWLTQMWKIPTVYADESALTNNTIYNADGSLKYCSVIWDGAYYQTNAGLAMANWSGIIPQLMCGPSGFSPSNSTTDSVFGAHFQSYVSFPACSSIYFYSNNLSQGCSNYTLTSSAGGNVANLTVNGGLVFWEVNGNVTLGVTKGINTICLAFYAFLVSPDSCSRVAPYTYTILVNFLKTAMGYIPLMIPNQVLACIRVDDMLGKLPLFGSSAPYPISYLDQFIQDLKANNATAELGFVIANQTQVPSQVLLNQTGVPDIDSWVNSIIAMVKGNMTTNGGPLYIFAHGYTHVVSNQTVYASASNPTNTNYDSEWVDESNNRAIPYSTQYTQMAKIYPVVQQWFGLTSMPLFVPSEGYYDNDTIQAAYDLGYRYFGCYWNTYYSISETYSMLGDNFTGYGGNPILVASGLETGIQPFASLPTQAYPEFAEYGIPLTPYLHAGGDLLLWNSSLQLINSLGAQWTSLENITDVYAKQVDLPTMNLTLYSNGTITGTLPSDGTSRKLFIDESNSAQKIVGITSNCNTNSITLTANTITLLNILAAGNYAFTITQGIGMPNSKTGVARAPFEVILVVITVVALIAIGLWVKRLKKKSSRLTDRTVEPQKTRDRSICAAHRNPYFVNTPKTPVQSRTSCCTINQEISPEVHICTWIGCHRYC